MSERIVLSQESYRSWRVISPLPLHLPVSFVVLWSGMLLECDVCILKEDFLVWRKLQFMRSDLVSAVSSPGLFFHPLKPDAPLMWCWHPQESRRTFLSQESCRSGEVISSLPFHLPIPLVVLWSWMLLECDVCILKGRGWDSRLESVASSLSPLPYKAVGQKLSRCWSLILIPGIKFIEKNIKFGGIACWGVSVYSVCSNTHVWRVLAKRISAPNSSSCVSESAESGF